MDEVEMLDDVEDVEDVEDVDEIEALDDVDEVGDDDEIIFDDIEPPDSSEGEGFSSSDVPLPSAGFPFSAPPPPSSRPPDANEYSSRSTTSARARRPTTSSGVDLPPSMRPNPSGLDLADDPDDEEEEFGELEFQDEPPTNPSSMSEAPPLPDLGEVRMDVPARMPVERSTAAEYATSLGPQIPHDHDELERELGVNLSVRVPGLSEGTDYVTGPSAPAPPDLGLPPNIGAPAPSFGMSRAYEPPPPSVEVPLGAYEDPFGDAVSPVPGRASVRPSQPTGAFPRLTSAESEPYALAPSAEMPPAAEAPRPPMASPIEPPSDPPPAPPPDVMVEPDQRPSQLPVVEPAGYRAAVSSAPDLDEFDNMFEALSRPPPKPSTAPSEQQDIPVDAPAPPPPLEALGITPLEDSAEQASLEPEVPAPAPDAEEGSVLVDGIDLMDIQGLQDLPEDSMQELARGAQLVTLQTGEEVSSFGVALVTYGAVQLMPTVADATCAIARKGEVLFTKGTLDSEVAVRVVGAEPGTRVVLFTKESLEKATGDCPWVADELAEVADKYLAFAGAVLGALGDSLDDMFRFMVLDKCEVKRKAPGAIIAHAGKSMDGMYILGGGTLEVLDADGAVTEELGMGDFVFPETVLSASPASASVRAGSQGALVLYAGRMSAHELLATCPPFIELLAG
jgi:CRP-like cAMP-binding protein